MTTFTAQVEKAIAKSKEKLLYVASQAIQDVVEAAQTAQASASMTGGAFVEGKIPVLTGDLRNSLTVGGAKGGEAYVAAIAGMEVGDVLRFEWTQPYAARIEFGFVGTDSLGRSYNQAGRHFIGANAAKWEQFVAARAAEVNK